ncbi:MAG: biopolymer transporter ExbD [Planctomycetes bacterium]|nr:biopolymer transporter ExbD [Planctomycetota bacterium]
MKVRHNKGGGDEKVELQMTPMIDIVFQLLVFFIMTFKIVSQEGDFNIKMPLAAPAAGAPDDLQLPPMKVRLRADADGMLAGMSLNDTGVPTMKDLRIRIIGFVGDDRGPGSIQETAEVELDCDYGLRYEHVIQAITAVSGDIDGAGNVVKLVEKIKFAPPRQPAGG